MLWESQKMVGVGWSVCLFAEKSADSRCIQAASFVASNAAMYSTSVVDKVVHS